MLRVALASTIGCSQAVAQAVGVTWFGELVAFDPVTGSGSIVGHTGLAETNAAAKLPDGSLLVSTKGPQPALWRVDPFTAESEFLAFSFVNDVRGLAVAPSGLVFAVEATGPASSDLHRIDLQVPSGSSEISELVGHASLGGLQGLTFASDGALLGWSTSWGLVRIDAETAICVDVLPGTDGTSGVQALFLAPLGGLLGAYDVLTPIDAGSGATGATTPLEFSNLRGAESVEHLSTLLGTAASVSLGAALSVELDGPSGGSFALLAGADHGPTAVGGLPFELDLGPDLASLVILRVGGFGAGGAATLSLPVPSDSWLAGLDVHLQAVTLDPTGAFGKSHARVVHLVGT